MYCAESGVEWKTEFSETFWNRKVDQKNRLGQELEL